MNKLENNILNISHNHYKYLMNLKNVIGVGCGYKYINNINTLEPCIHVLVKEKVTDKYLSSNNIIPKFYMGIKTDVVKIGHVKIKSGPLLKKIRPLEGGYGISIYKERGTLGCIVTKITNGHREFFILSNNHVLANGNLFPIGSFILQPSITVGGTVNDVVGILHSFIPIKYIDPKNPSVPPVNYVDCALAKIYDLQLISNRIGEIGPITGLSDLSLNDYVKKSGASTGLTEGFVKTLGVSIEVDFSGHDVFFKDQIIAELYNKDGDSGSLVLNQNNKAVGLFFAGQGDDIAIINNIRAVLNVFGVNIYK